MVLVAWHNWDLKKQGIARAARTVRDSSPVRMASASSTVSQPSVAKPASQNEAPESRGVAKPAKARRRF